MSSRLISLLRLGLLAIGVLATVVGLINMAIGDFVSGVPEAVGGVTLLYVLWWLPRRSVRKAEA